MRCEKVSVLWEVKVGIVSPDGIRGQRLRYLIRQGFVCLELA